MVACWTAIPNPTRRFARIAASWTRFTESRAPHGGGQHGLLASQASCCASQARRLNQEVAACAVKAKSCATPRTLAFRSVSRFDMNTSLLNDKFARMGARLKLAETPARRRVPTGMVRLDVRSDRHGEFFEIHVPPRVESQVEVLDLQPAERHLLLLVREDEGKAKFLCGHDERHWFVAAIPESAPVGTVVQAKEALKPAAVRAAQGRRALGGKARNRRKNAAYIRQGEWFFVPAADLSVDAKLVLPNEPLSRGNGGKPHWAEFCHRTGGETVYVCVQHAQGVTEAQYKVIVARNPKARNWGWRAMRRNAGVYVKGRVRHADHATIMLHGWHEVFMNTEGQSRAMRNVVFLD